MSKKQLKIIFIIICTVIIEFQLYEIGRLSGMKKILQDISVAVLAQNKQSDLLQSPALIDSENSETGAQEGEYIELPIDGYEPMETTSKIIVLDPGHGKSSRLMSDDEKRASGWQYNANRGGWGEWRHWRSGTLWNDCYGTGCTERAPANGSCWYPIGGGDRDIEPDINLNNTLAAKKYLEEMGYTVRMTRTDNETNPSMTQRLMYCYPDMDTMQNPDADLFVCIHSNAGGGTGSCYISLSGIYDQAGISDTYIEDGNTLGKYINDEIINTTSLSSYAGGEYTGYPELVLFCKSPITIAYLEIGFFDNSRDLNILQSESDQIGMAIANGIDKYVNDYGI